MTNVTIGRYQAANGIQGNRQDGGVDVGDKTEEEAEIGNTSGTALEWRYQCKRARGVTLIMPRPRATPMEAHQRGDTSGTEAEGRDQWNSERSGVAPETLTHVTEFETRFS